MIRKAHGNWPLGGFRRLLFILVTGTSALISQIVAQEGSDRDKVQAAVFGPKLEQRPAKAADIHAPVWLSNGPTNEATMVRLQRGEIRIFFIDRPGSARRLMSISSHDEGLNWSAPREEAPLAGEAYYAQQVYQDIHGTLHAIYHTYGTGSLGYRGRHLDLWHMQKPPGGTWSASTRIFYGYVGSVRSLIGLRDGRLIISMYEADTARAVKPAKGRVDFGLFGVITLWSDDGGLHWQKSAQRLDIEVDPEQVTRYGAVEPVTIELEDGRLWMLIRTNKGHLFETWSDDRGEHWLPPVRSTFISSDSPAGLLRLADGRIVLFTNACQRYDNPRSYANGGREVLHAAISEPNRAEWQGFREVLVSRTLPPNQRGDRGTAYPSAVETPSGKVLFVSGQGSDASIAAFDPDWLTASSHKDLSGMDPRWWTRHGTDTGEYVFNFPMSSRGHLSICFPRSSENSDLRLSLTDHFSIAADTMALGASPIVMRVKGGRRQKGDDRITIRWNNRKGEISGRWNGRRKGLDIDIRQSLPAGGFNYLRVSEKTCGISMRTK
jgi:hypothetical protein